MKQSASFAVPFLASLASFLAGCASGPNNTEALKRLLAIEKPFNEAFVKRDAKALTAFYADDGESQGPFEGPVHGQATLSKMFQEAVKDPNFTFTFHHDTGDITVSGDMGVTRGTFFMTGTNFATGRKMELPGYYQTVWKRDQDGNWKVWRDMMTPSKMPLEVTGAAASGK